MSKWDFFASVIGSISWPTSIIILAIILRKKLGDLFDALTHFRYGGLEVVFSEHIKDLSKIKDISEDVKNKTSRQLQDAMKFLTYTSTPTVIDNQPASSIITYWDALEREIMSTVTRLNILPSDSIYQNSYHINISVLRKNGHLDAKDYAILERLRFLRDIIAHGKGDISRLRSSDAREFVDIANTLMDKLKNISIK